MGKVLDWVSRAITARPWITLAVLVAVTVVLAAGFGQRASQAENEAFLPQDSDVARAMDEVETLFGDSADVKVTTLVFRGEALTPEGLVQMEELLAAIASDPKVASLLPPINAVFAPSLFLKGVLQVEGFESVSQAEIDGALDYLRTTPEAAAIQAAITAMVGRDAEGSPVGVGTVRLLDTGDDAVDDAERRIDELGRESEGPLRVSSVSIAVIEDEVREATGSRMLPLLGIALLVIVVLTMLFMRTLSDLLLTLGGILLAIIWTIGAEGWLGPDALGVIGPPNALTSMVPLILISLSVDYSIQAVSHYREQRIAGEPVAAARAGLRFVIPAAAGRAHHDRQLPHQPALADLADRRFWRGRGAGGGAQPDRDADAPAGSTDDHRPTARGARHASAGASDRKGGARHRPAGGAAGDIDRAPASALHHLRGGGNDRAGTGGYAPDNGLQRA